jgi:hypothetical protein
MSKEAGGLIKSGEKKNDANDENPFDMLKNGSYPGGYWQFGKNVSYYTPLFLRVCFLGCW